MVFDIGIWSKCLLPKMAESRDQMGARYIYSLLWHTQLVNEGKMDQTSTGTKL